MSWVWTVLECYHLWEVVLLAAAVTTVFLLALPFHLPDLRPLPLDHPACDQELASLGFEKVGCFDATMHPSVNCRFHAYLSNDHRHGAAVMELSTKFENKTVKEFSTRLTPSGSVTTNNSHDPLTFYRPPEKIAVCAHWKQGFAELFQLHQSLCEAAGESGFTPRKFEPDNFRALLDAWLREDFEAQVRTGRMRRVGENAYRFTLKGAAITTPVVWWFMSYGFILRRLRPGDKTLVTRARRRFARLRNAACRAPH